MAFDFVRFPTFEPLPFLKPPSVPKCLSIYLFIKASFALAESYDKSIRFTLQIQIHPPDPSTSFRVTYLLRLIGGVLGSILGYEVEALNHSTLHDLLDFLHDLDRPLIAVFHSQGWDPVSARGVDIVLGVTLGLLATSDAQEGRGGISTESDRPCSPSKLALLKEFDFGRMDLEQNKTGGYLWRWSHRRCFRHVGADDQFDKFVRTLD